jgi:hypothetical protein
MRTLPSKDPMDENFKRMYYVRYADDFIIGLQGSRKDAQEIVQNLDSWLKTNLKLTLHPDKTFIRHFRSEGTHFLGIDIGPLYTGEKPVTLHNHGKKYRITPRLPMKLNIKKLFKRLFDRGFVKWDRNKQIYVGIAYSRLQNLDIADIIRYYNSVFRGLWNYYCFVDNRSNLHNVWWALQMSLAYTISRKNRMTRIHKVFKQYGYPTKEKDNKVEFWKPQTFTRDPKILQI